jgi:hypothetical protein
MSAATSTRIAAGVTTAYLRDLARRPAPAMSARATTRRRQRIPGAGLHPGYQ